MVEETMQLKLSHHLHGVVERVNERNGPFVGLLMTTPTEEITLQVSGFSVPSSDFLELAGLFPSEFMTTIFHVPGSEVAVVLKRDILPTGKTKSCIRIERFFCAYICR
uniref:Uncharacterized protein n=1 Tax=Vitis vinifera TaxID=29760 RepID=F6HEF2_VITVI